MTKLAIIGDLHFGHKGCDPNFLEFQLKYFENFLKQCKENKVDMIIQCGDFFDVRKYTANILLNAVIEKIVPMIKATGIPLCTIAGNHDLGLRHSSQIFTSKLLGALGDGLIKIVPNYEEIDLGGVRASLVGWMNQENTLDILQKLDQSESELVFGHFELVDFPFSATTIASHGMKPDFLEKFEAAFTGHYHCISSHKNILYVGSPYHLTWADYVDETNRGWFLYDTKSKQLDLMNNTDDQTLFVTIDYDSSIKYTEEYFEPYQNKILKVFVNEKDDTKLFNKFDKLLKTISFIDYSIIDNTIKESAVIEIDTKKMSLDMLATFNDYISKQEHDNKNEVKQLAKQYYESVKYECK